VPRPTNTLAIVSLVAGIAGYVLPHPFIAGLVAIVTGHMARGQIRRTGERGGGLALAGLLLGYIHFALSLILIAFILAFVFGLGLWIFTRPAGG
jgi:uncharacterized transporter YbjL